MYSGVPRIVVWKLDHRVLRPKSPIKQSPLLLLMNILSHFKSRWIIGGSWLCKYASPSKIPRHHRLITFKKGLLMRLKYPLSEPPVTISVINTTSSRFVLTHARKKWRMFGWPKFYSILISSVILFRSDLAKFFILILFQATSQPDSLS